MRGELLLIKHLRTHLILISMITKHSQIFPKRILRTILKTYLNQNSHMHNIPIENNLTSQLSSFITELKSIINLLIQLLTTVINQLILKNDK